MSGLLDQLKAASTDAKAPAAREGAFVAYADLATGAPRLAEPYLVPMLPTILDKCSDKVLAAIFERHQRSASLPSMFSRIATLSLA